MTDNKQLETLRNNLRQELGKYRKRVFEIKKYGLDFRFSRMSINKLGCIKSVNNSIHNGFTASEHFEAAENIKDLFEKSELYTRNYHRKNNGILETHSYCVCQIHDNVFANMNLVTWDKEGRREGYIDLYLSKEVE